MAIMCIISHCHHLNLLLNKSVNNKHSTTILVSFESVKKSVMIGSIHNLMVHISLCWWGICVYCNIDSGNGLAPNDDKTFLESVLNKTGILGLFFSDRSYLWNICVLWSTFNSRNGLVPNGAKPFLESMWTKVHICFINSFCH